MIITEQFEEARAILERSRVEGKGPVRLVALRAPLHAGKTALIREASGMGGALLVAVLGGMRGAFESPAAAEGASLVFLADEALRSSRPEDVFSSLFSVDEVVLGEDQYIRLRRFEETAKGRKAFRVRRMQTFRDIDGIPLSRASNRLTAPERFSARFVPQALTKAGAMVESGERSAAVILERTLENLEKSQGLAVCNAVIYSSDRWDQGRGAPQRIEDRIVPGARLWVTATAGEHEIEDSRELRSAS